MTVLATAYRSGKRNMARLFRAFAGGALVPS